MIFHGLMSLVLAWTPVQMASPCVPWEMMHQIVQNHSEEIAGRGLSVDGGALFELWLAPDGSFSITARATNGMMCMIGAGEGWQVVKGGSKI